MPAATRMWGRWPYVAPPRLALRGGRSLSACPSAVGSKRCGRSVQVVWRSGGRVLDTSNGASLWLCFVSCTRAAFPFHFSLAQAHSAVHLVAGSTTSPVLAQIARSELARPLVSASVELFSRASHVFPCILLQSSILHRLFGCIRSVSGGASHGVQGHSVNASMQTYADAQLARASSSLLSTRFLFDFCTMH